MKTSQQIIEEYKAEYFRTNGKPIEVTYNHGWYSIGHKQAPENVRRKDILTFTDRLRQRPTRVDRYEMVNGVSTLVKANEHVVQNLVTKKDVIEDINTPACCSVACEVYWTM